ncbi:MAG: hypothetical protein QNK24_16200 [Desulfuromusa sp.]|nr:hypothetical protein [Desulfuromusa sp.]
MEVLTYNPQKGRLETINADFTEDTTTWFDGTGSSESVRMITDLDNGLLITPAGREYPVIIYDISREGINYNRKKAGKLFRQVLF